MGPKKNKQGDPKLGNNNDCYRFGTWNVRSLTGKEIELIEEMKKYRLDVLGVSEGKMRGNGMKTVDGMTCVYSGVQQGRAKAGVAIYMVEELAMCIKEWKCINERLVLVRLKIREEWVCFVQVYAPTENCSVEDKEEFFDTLQETVSGLQRRDKIIILGDFNARVGNKRGEWREVIGGCGEETCNDNGKRLLEFCATNGLIISNTWYQHKEIHQFTWECRGRGLKSILDYFLVRREDRRRVKDTKVVRGAEIGSDHYLVLLKLTRRPHIRQEVRRSDHRRLHLNRWKLKEKEAQWRFRMKLERRLDRARYWEGSNVEEVWGEFKKNVMETAAEVCGTKQYRNAQKRTRWWNEEVKQAIKNKKVAYLKWLQQQTSEAKERYQEAKKEAKRVVRQARNEEWIELGKSLEDDFQKNQKRFWSRVRMCNENKADVAGKICDESGQLIVDDAGVRNRWKAYFSDLLQEDAQGQNGNQIDREVQLDEEERAPIAVEEVEVAISKLKNGKSPGICGISAEMLKAGRTVVVKWLHRIMSLAWENGQVPEDWRRAVIVPVHKKGSKVKCENYRGISLLSIPSKAYAKILDERIRSVTESKVLEAQGGFRKGRSCTDQLFTIRQLSEKMIEKNKKMVVACVDLEKAYDRVGRDKLWKVLEEYGVKGRLLRAIRSFYKKSEGCVRVKDELSSWFPITQGVRQGCVMSPWLFNVFMDKIVREGMENFVGGVKMSTTEVGIVLFADDVMLLTERKEDMEANLRELKKAMSNWGMKIHWGKTKVMMVSRKGEECKVCVDGEEIEQVQNMKYLGAILSADGTCEEEIEQRVGAAARVIGAMRKEVLERKELKKATKMRVYNAIVLPTMLYGSETWTVMKRHESRLGATEMAYLRRVEGVTRMDRVRNADVREAVGQEEVMEKVKRKQRAWKEKLEQMEDNRLVKKVYTEEIAGKRPRGRPRKKWIDSF